MAKKNTTGTNIKGIDNDLHFAVKEEAVRRRISVNEMYIITIGTGVKRLGLTKSKNGGRAPVIASVACESTKIK